MGGLSYAILVAKISPTKALFVQPKSAGAAFASAMVGRVRRVFFGGMGFYSRRFKLS